MSNTAGYTNGINISSPDLNVDVVIIGGGFSGISTLYRTRKLGLKAVILESGNNFGGVWYHNRYPGARVDSEWPFYQLDIPEVYRTFTFSERFPGHAELREYMAYVDKTLNLRKDTIFNAHVNDCTWDPDQAKWTVKTEQGHVATGKYLVLCAGLLHRRHYPEFPGLDKFKGEIHHSGFWPEELSTKDKNVVLIGAGATAVQITQEVSKVANQLTILMRRPSYCLPIFQRKLDKREGVGFQAYYGALFREGRKSYAGFPGGPPSPSAKEDTPEQREKIFEEYYHRGGFQFLSCYADSMFDKESNKLIYDYWSRKTRARMRPGKKRDLIAPTVENMPYYWGTKRPPLEHDYYESVDRDNVDVVNMNEKKIQSFTEKGLVYEDGDELEFDILILATGFDSFSGSIAHMGLKNKDGIDIKEIWQQGIKSYLGMTMAGFPNTFMIYSPHAPTALSNGPTIIESQADMVTDLIANLEKSDVRCVTPREDAQEEWVNLVEALSAHTLLPLTNSWWTGANVPGKKVQQLTYVLGIGEYEKQCRAALDQLKGLDVEYHAKKGEDGTL